MQDHAAKNIPHDNRPAPVPGTLLLLTLFALATPGHAATLSISLSDQSSPPYIMGEGEQIPAKPGLAVELAQSAAKACKLDLTLERQPSLRLLQNLKSGKNPASLQLSYAPERAAFASYPQENGQLLRNMRISTLRYILYVQTNSPLKWDGKQLTPPTAVVGSNLGWSINGDLEKLGIRTETALSVKSNFNKLLAGRISAYAVQEELGSYYLASQHLQSRIQPLPVVLKEKDYYMPFNADFARQNPKMVQCMWQQIAKLRDPLFRSSLRHYLGH